MYFPPPGWAGLQRAEMRVSYIESLAAKAKARGLDPDSLPAFRSAKEARAELRLQDYKRIIRNIRVFVLSRSEKIK